MFTALCPLTKDEKLCFNYSYWLFNHLLTVRSANGKRFNTNYSLFSRAKERHHHGFIQISQFWHIPVPLSFSLDTTFNISILISPKVIKWNDKKKILYQNLRKVFIKIKWTSSILFYKGKMHFDKLCKVFRWQGFQSPTFSYILHGSFLHICF